MLRNQIIPSNINTLEAFEPSIESFFFDENLQGTDQLSHAKRESAKTLKALYQSMRPLDSTDKVKGFLKAIPYRFSRTGYTGMPDFSVNKLCAKLAMFCVNPSQPDAQEQFWKILYPEITGLVEGEQWPHYGEALLDDELAEGKAGRLINYRTMYQNPLSVGPNKKSEGRIRSFNKNHLEHWMKSSEQHKAQYQNYYDFFVAMSKTMKNWDVTKNFTYADEIPLEGDLALLEFQRVLSSERSIELNKKVFKFMKIPGFDISLSKIIENFCRREELNSYAAKTKNASSSSAGTVDSKHCLNINSKYLDSICNTYSEDLKNLSLVSQEKIDQDMQGEDHLEFSSHQLIFQLKNLNESALADYLRDHQQRGINFPMLVGECKRRIEDPNEFTFLTVQSDRALPNKNRARELYNCMYHLNDKEARAQFLEIYLGKDLVFDAILDGTLESFVYLFKIIDIDFMDVDLKHLDVLIERFMRAARSGNISLKSINDFEALMKIRPTLGQDNKFYRMLVEHSIFSQKLIISLDELNILFDKYKKSNYKDFILSCFRSPIKEYLISPPGLLAKFRDSPNSLLCLEYFNVLVHEFKDELNEMIILSSNQDFQVIEFFSILGKITSIKSIVQVNQKDREAFGILFEHFYKNGIMKKSVGIGNYADELLSVVRKAFDGVQIPRTIIEKLFNLLDGYDLAKHSLRCLIFLASTQRDEDLIEKLLGKYDGDITQDGYDYFTRLDIVTVLDKFKHSTPIGQFINALTVPRVPALIVFNHNQPSLYRLHFVMAQAFKLANKTPSEYALDDVYRYFQTYFRPNVPGVQYVELLELLDNLDLQLFLFSKWHAGHSFPMISGFSFQVSFESLLESIKDLNLNQEKVFTALFAQIYDTIKHMTWASSGPPSLALNIDSVSKFFPDIFSNRDYVLKILSKVSQDNLKNEPDVIGFRVKIINFLRPILTKFEINPLIDSLEGCSDSYRAAVYHYMIVNPDEFRGSQRAQSTNVTYRPSVSSASTQSANLPSLKEMQEFLRKI